MSIRRTLTGLLVGVAIAGLATAAQAQATYVREAQQHLIELGYAPGAADGYVGPTTRDAITAFQRDNQLPVTGVLDDLTLRSIRDSVINQTLFGGAVTLELDRPEPEIVPLNPDGTAAAEASPQSVSPPASVAGTGDGTGSSQQAEALPDVADARAGQTALPEQFDSTSERVQTQQPAIDSDVAASETFAGEEAAYLDVPAADTVRAEPAETVLPDTGSLPSLDLSDLASDADSLPPQPGPDSEAALPPLDLDPIAQVPEATASQQLDEAGQAELAFEPAAGPETLLQQETPVNSGMAASIIDRTRSWIQSADYWVLGVVTLVVVALVWLIGRRLFGPSEPKRVAMTREEYMASGGEKRARHAFQPRNNSAAVDRGRVLESRTRNRPAPVGFCDDDAEKPPTQSGASVHAVDTQPSTVRIGAIGSEFETGDAEIQEPRRGADARPGAVPAPLSSHQPRMRTVASGDAARPVARFSDHRKAQPPRIVRSNEQSGEAANDGTAATGPQRPGVHAMTLKRVGSGDSGEIFARRGREGHVAATTATGPGTSDGRLVRPVRPRREEA